MIHTEGREDTALLLLLLLMVKIDLEGWRDEELVIVLVVLPAVLG